jgi:UDP-N-acetylmuramoyl-L-alanyl-D-glutamate--2,6-diaminopimelate ligase
MSLGEHDTTVAWISSVAATSAELTTDSRTVAPGDVFCAYPGAVTDGRRFIPEAIRRGAAAVLWDPAQGFAWNPQWPVAHRPVADLKALCGPIAAQWYGHPSKTLFSIGVTGTSGKSSSALWLAQAYEALGRRAAVVGTLGAGPPEALVDTGHTTPDPVRLQRLLARFVRDSIQVVVMEVSSIGLEEGRVNGMHFDLALFCNLSRDHLDYHGTMEAYAAAKARLFAWPGLSHALLNLDDPRAPQMAEVARSRNVTVHGFSTLAAPGATFRADHVSYAALGMEFDLHGPFGTRHFSTPLIGTYNVSNLLGVFSALVVGGIDTDLALRAMARLTPAPGRLERVPSDVGPMVLVDYAHKPDALEKAIRACRPLVEARGGQLTVVFGCGGDRDPGKRPLMGSIAAELADRLVVTSDNPRSEDPAVIASAILEGIPPGAIPFVLELDRRMAIERAISEAKDRDLVLIAGKGHETYQETLGVKSAFSDVAEARRALQASFGVGAC